MNNTMVKMQLKNELDKIDINKLDNEIIKYFQNNNIYNLQTSYIPANILYESAKNLYKSNSTLAFQMISQLDSIYFFGYSCFIAANNKDIDTINHFILLCEKSYRLNNCFFEYSYRIIEIAFSIVDVYPYIALELFSKINNNSNNELPNETLDLAVKIVSYQYLRSSLKLFHIVEIEYYNIISN